MPLRRSARLWDLDTWGEVWSSMRRNKLRVFLTACGVFWGMLMLTLLLGFGAGLQHGVQRDFMGLARYLVFIMPDKTLLGYDGLGPGRKIQMTNDDIDAVSRVPGVQMVVPRLTLGTFGVGLAVTAGTKTANVTVACATPDYPAIEPIELVYGRHLNFGDQNEERKVAVIGKNVSRILYGDDSPVGRLLSFRGVFFQVVGAHRSLKSGPQADRTDNSVFIPLSIAQRAFNQKGNVTWASVVVNPGASAADVQTEVVARLRKRHHVHPDDPQGIRSYSLAGEFNRLMDVFTGMRVFLWFVGITTLMAGILGVSNILLITVKERTQEIGLRKALGATPSSIVRMVVAESLVLISLAGYLGIVVGVALLDVISRVSAKMPEAPISSPEVDLEIVLGASAIILIGGLIAAVVPARHAARLRPVDALRAE